MLGHSPRADRSWGRARRFIAALLAVGAGLALVAGCVSSGPTATRAVSSPPPARAAPSLPPARAELTVAARARLAVVPRSFLGLSTEYWTLPLLQRRPALLDRAIDLLHVRGDGRLVLRIGGDSADHAFWDPRPRTMPTWAFGVTPPWLRQVSRLVRRLHLRVIVDLNLITDSPARAARWAAAVRAGLPRGSLAAFEVGNEPDIYDRPYWRAMTSAAPLGQAPPRALTAADYATAFGRYARALESVAPHVGLAGPALANPDIDAGWVSALLRGDRRSVALITVHAYPYSVCVAPDSRRYPTIARLLSRHATAGIAAALAPAVRIARSSGIGVRVTELNSVTCGGRPGVSDAFATALWAPDALFDLVRAGVVGVNVHLRAGTVNAPFTIGRRGLIAHPLLYGLVLFARTLGSDAELAGSRLRAASDLHLAAWPVTVAGHRLHLLLVDSGPRAVRVAIRVPTTGAAAVQRLLARSPSSTGGVTLDGRRLAADGRWQGAPATSHVARRAAGYVVVVGPDSAALLSARLRRRAL